jgi:hypothetical protein
MSAPVKGRLLEPATVPGELELELDADVAAV